MTLDASFPYKCNHSPPQEMIKKAFGGILLVDEAYYLYNAANDKDYGQESIEILLNVMEEQKEDLIVTLAGCAESACFIGFDFFFVGLCRHYCCIDLSIPLGRSSGCEKWRGNFSAPG